MTERDPDADADADADAMLLVKGGDPRAFSHLVRRFLRPLAAFFHRLGADAATAEDCAQDVFLKLYRTRATYEPRARFSTYLFSIARHHWIDVVRHRAAGPVVVSGPSTGAGEDDRGDSERFVGRDAPVDEEARRAELSVAVRQAVAALPAEQREVFALVQSEGMKYAEIADVLKIPVGTVKSRVHAVMAALREALSRGGFEP